MDDDDDGGFFLWDGTKKKKKRKKKEDGINHDDWVDYYVLYSVQSPPHNRSIPTPYSSEVLHSTITIPFLSSLRSLSKQASRSCISTTDGGILILQLT